MIARASRRPDDPATVPGEPVAWRSGGWRFPPELEAQFERDTGAARVRDLLWAGVVAIAVYDAFLVNDALARPEAFGAALFWRLGVVTVYGLLVLALIRRGLPPAWREGAMASAIVVAMGSSCMIFRATTSPVGVHDPFTFGLILLAGNIVFRLRFVAALVSSVAALAVAAALLLSHDGVPPAARPFVIGMLLATAVFTLLAAFRLERAERRAYRLMRRESRRSEAALRAADQYAALSETDALTELANRRAFDLELPRRWDEAADGGRSLALLLVDIDHFKRYNDRFGHPAGDACLRQVARTLRGALRDGDFIARIGGEEFAALLGPPSREETALQLAERLRRRVEEAAIPHDGAGGQGVVTISLGLASSDLAQVRTSIDLVAAADAALYDAKSAGRNRCVRSDDPADRSATRRSRH